MKSLPFVPSGAFPAVIVPLTDAAVPALVDHAVQAVTAPGVHALEWRVDTLQYFLDADHTLDTHEIEPVRAAITEAVDSFRDRVPGGFPVLVTIRTVGEGGHADLTDAAYAHLIDHIVNRGPVAVDIEWQRADSKALIGRAKDAGVVPLASFHDFEKTPPAEYLYSMLQKMERDGAETAKIAVMPNTRTDVLEVLSVADRAQAKMTVPVITISMGDLGKATRLVGSEFGSAATWAAVGELSAPGQLTADEVRGTLEALGRA
ncbi:type I 3-dehydroquinate dehydratase [Brevibacterium litoralis]|uniref:type I 3-dehydroquinate dehydratase n=1 Tax=Brevibacterium litoralis TaxID=3138935 RepID=UPI0032EF80D6